MTNKICDGCETVAHCMKNGCVPKTTKQTQVRSTEEAPARSALKLALEALEHCKDVIIERGLNGNPEFAKKWGLTLPLERSEKAITAIRSALAGESSGTEQPAQRKPLDEVFVPLNVLEAAESSLGSFCSDHGWSDEDMQNMDNLSAYIAQHKAAHGIKENPNDQTN